MTKFMLGMVVLHRGVLAIVNIALHHGDMQSWQRYKHVAENLITIGVMLGVSPVLAAVLSDAFDTFEEGCVRMLFVQAIIGIVLIIFGAGVMLGGE